MFWQSDFCSQIRSLPLTVRYPKTPEIRHFWRPYVSFRDINTTVSTWHEKMKLLIHTCASKRELVHWLLPVRNIASRNISTICLFVRNISTGLGSLPVIGNMSTSYDLLLNYRTKKFKFTADSSCFSNIKLRLYTVPVFLLPATQFPWRYFWPIRTRSRNKV